ncbi:CpsD/CapB family tyrosine-protein kinase [Rubellimicrobium rubrum]|uniref:CpsD/CapB family tyrosine-protein kinase n=1 Tax=Rubellimicrobium rubrum TaxID=2585369 RepID=A0A5C4N0H6_9RHOB|nr:CpsD/CapB family tyrosine-protein kinase [Rubellimicrobium rubrum]TNC50401.1 CpsD/CapB family tyrosine-protein kinase [Rubellimicrobium rubrum]
MEADIVRKPKQPLKPQVGPTAPIPQPQHAIDTVADTWDSLRLLPVAPAVLERNLVITAGRRNPAHGAFDVLRTKLVQAMAERGWRRLGITSPTKGCGKSFVAVNLAVTLSRYDSYRTVLLDMDLRLSSLAHKLGIPNPGLMADFLTGQVAANDFFYRVGPNPLRIGPSLAIGLNGRPEPFAAELFYDSKTAEALKRMEAMLAPQMVLFDLPPALAQDDVLSLKPHLDCILMVAGGGITTTRDLQAASRRLGDDLPLLGVVLNKAEGNVIMDYTY